MDNVSCGLFYPVLTCRERSSHLSRKFRTFLLTLLSHPDLTRFHLPRLRWSESSRVVLCFAFEHVFFRSSNHQRHFAFFYCGSSLHIWSYTFASSAWPLYSITSKIPALFGLCYVRLRKWIIASEGSEDVK